MRKRLIVLALFLVGAVAALVFATGDADRGAQAAIVMVFALCGAVQVLAVGFTCPRCGARLGGNNPWSDLTSELTCHQCGLSERKSIAAQCPSSAAECPIRQASYLGA
jgi:rubredoxin